MEMLNFTHNGKERNCRRINIGDHAAARAKLRRERIDALSGPGGGSPMAIGAAVAVPVSPEEEIDFFYRSVTGLAFVLYRCVHDIDQTFTEEEAGQMVLENDPFLDRLYSESRSASPLKSGG